jgi:hypothetical protein
MQLQFEFRDHSEVAAAATQGPKQIRILACVGPYDGTVRSYEGKSLDVIAGQSESAGKPAGPSAQDQSGSSGMRDDARGKYQPCFLGCRINRAQQTTSGDHGMARLGIHGNLPHSRQVNHHAAIARAKTRETMPSAADGGKNSDLRAGADCILHIDYIGAARDKARSTSDHAIPDDARIFVAAFAGTQQITFESPLERRVNLLAGFDHFGLSCQSAFLSQQ